MPIARTLRRYYAELHSTTIGGEPFTTTNDATDRWQTVYKHFTLDGGNFTNTETGEISGGNFT